MQKKTLYFAVSLALLLVLFASLSLLSGRLLRGMRLDLSENHLYTLSEGTRNVLAGLEEPVNIYLFFSQENSRELPQIRSYAQRVDELLDEFANRSDGKLQIHHVDPEPFSEKEDEAARYGLQAVPVGVDGNTLYLGIAATNSLDDVQAMPFLQPSKEKFLEYDLAKMVSALGHPQRKTIGLISSLPMTAGFDPQTQSTREQWVVYEQLSQLFTIKTIDGQDTKLPEGLDMLVLVHPRNLTPELLYQVDQFVLGGGRLLVFIDPLAESDRGDPADPMAQMQAGSSSTLEPLLKAWGLSFDTQKVLGDLQYGVGSGGTRHIGILSVPRAGMNADDVVSADLEMVNFSSTGWLQPLKETTTNIEVLVESSENAGPIDASRMRFLANPNDLMQGFTPTGEKYALAVRITGPVRSAFGDSPPAQAGKDDVAGKDDLAGKDALKESAEGGINVMIFADSDILSDRLWVQKQPFLGQNVVTAFADNGNIVVNAVDNLLGNNDLISIRTRDSSARPFERVDELQLEAEREYRATEERLQQELTETERKLTELQSGRPEADLLVLTDEQKAALQKFVDRKLEIRKELRQVQHDLQRDIDRLGTRLKLVNIVLVPVLVIAAAALFGWRRRQRQVRQAHEE